MKSKIKCYEQSVVNYLQEGLSTREIGEKLKISQSMVQRIRNGQKNLSSNNKGGRPRKLSVQDQRSLVRYLVTGRAKTTSEAAAVLKQDCRVSVSRWTVKRALNEANFTAIEKKKKPLLSERNIRQRKNFVQKYEHWSEEDWMKVVWSDESKINRYRTDGRSWSWKRQGESLQPRDYIQTIKHNGGNIKVWGCFSANGVGPIFKIDGIMDKNMYLSILKDKLAETIDFMPYPNKSHISTR
ncbi:hypothetical protein M8J77_026155 [Diaphorina citri]|nr:hypothetical protein M8J77_026155 [Diaphorina citri]